MAEKKESPALGALREKEGQALEREGLGDEFQEGLGELLEAPLPAQFLADDEECLSVFIGALDRKSVV